RPAGHLGSCAVDYPLGRTDDAERNRYGRCPDLQCTRGDRGGVPRRGVVAALAAAPGLLRVVPGVAGGVPVPVRTGRLPGNAGETRVRPILPRERGAGRRL